MKITKKVRIQTPLVNTIIDLVRLLGKVLKKDHCIGIKCQHNPDDKDVGSFKISFPYYGGGSPEEWLVWKDKFLKALKSQGISTGPLKYTFAERFLTGVEKATFEKGCPGYWNKVLAGMTKHAFSAYALCE